MNSPRVVVVSIYFNRESDVHESVESLKSQDLGDAEYLLVDDGSTDDTERQLRKHQSEQFKVVSTVNWGFTRQLIESIRSTTPPYIAIHGSGDISYPDRLSKQLAVLLSNECIGVVGARMHRKTLNGSREEVPTRGVEADERQNLLRRNGFGHGEVMFRRSHYNQAGGYRGFFTKAQDYDLWCRMSRVCEFYECPEFLYERRQLADGVTVNPRSRLDQLLFGTLAVHCHRRVLEGAPDPLDHFGLGCLATRAFTTKLARRLDAERRHRNASGDSDPAGLEHLVEDISPGLLNRLERQLRTVARRLGNR